MIRYDLLREKATLIFADTHITSEQKYDALEHLISKHVEKYSIKKGDYVYFPILVLAYAALNRGDHEECLYELQKCIRFYSELNTQVLHHVLYFLQQRRQMRDDNVSINK